MSHHLITVININQVTLLLKLFLSFLYLFILSWLLHPYHLHSYLKQFSLCFIFGNCPIKVHSAVLRWPSSSMLTILRQLSVFYGFWDVSIPIVGLYNTWHCLRNAQRFWWDGSRVALSSISIYISSASSCSADQRWGELVVDCGSQSHRFRIC